jgi:branched-subunit amino acid ABC-type transport system permease component
MPAGTVPPEVHDLLAQLLPSSLSSWRDAIVFVFLILMLLFRPQGILRGRAREETP